MHKSYDLFISYRHSGSGASNPNAVPDLMTALEEQDFKVFLDQTEISEFSKITKRVEESLANSKALLVYLSHDYFASRACQIEFTAAFIASFKNRGKPEDRIFIINPSGKTDYLKKLPVELSDAKFAMSPEQALSVLPEKLNNLNGTFKDLGLVARPHVYGAPALTGYSRFSGRIEDMWNIHSGLNASECSMVTGHVSSGTVILIGLGGIGKSLLAEEYAIRFGSAYPGGIYWLKAYGSYNPENHDIEGFKTACKNEFIKIAQTSGINPAPDSSIEQLRYLIHQIIEKRAKECLWVVDDIPQGLSEYVDEIKNWFGPHPLAKTLVTTRSREYSNIGKECLIDVLDKDSALEILNKHGIDIEKEKSDAEKLVEDILGFHALAVDISGAAINNANMSINEYIKETQCGAGDILLEMPDELINALPNGHETSIVKTISRSISKLPEKSGGLDFLRLAAVVSPATISNNLVKQVFEITSEVVAGADRRQAILAAPACLKYSLATKDGTGWTVHALISATVRFEGLADDDTGKTIKASAIKVLADLIKYNLCHEETIRLLPEVEHARFITTNFNSLEELKLLIIVSDFDHNRGNVNLAVEGWTRILHYCEANLGLDHQSTIASRSNLISALIAQGNIKGVKEHYEQIIDQSEKINGSVHPDTLAYTNNFADALLRMGAYKEAKEIYELAIERSMAIFGPDDRNTLISINGLSHTLKRLEYYNVAKKLDEYVFERRKHTLGPDHRETIDAQMSIAISLNLLGDHSSAIELYEDAFERYKQLLGPNHPDTLRAMHNIAKSYTIIGEYNRSKELHKECLELRKKSIGSDHPDTIESMNNLACTLGELGDLCGSRELHEHVIEHYKQILGPDHPDTLSAIADSSVTLQRMGDYNGYIISLKYIIEYSNKYIGSVTYWAIKSVGLLANDLYKMGDLNGAKELNMYITGYSIHILGPDHSDTLNSMSNLASTLMRLGDHNGAKDIQENVLERRKQIFGIYHPDTTLSAWNFFGTLHETGEVEKAIEVVRDNLFWLFDDSIQINDAGQIRVRQMLAEVLLKNRSNTED